MASRNFTLTEELERLEQSITLTLQEIDHNFSRAHRIITTSILPIVEDYAKHSEAVWEGSKFWKQFFEASANVSLSGYEEADLTASMAHEETEASTVTTPRMHPTESEAGTPGAASFAQYRSPYETLKRESHGEGDEDGDEDEPEASSTPIGREPETPAKTQTLPDMSMTPESSPFNMPSSAVAPSTQRHANTNNDPLLHRMLDKTYRIAATPMTARKQKFNVTATPGTASRTRTFHSRLAEDSSPLSSPEIAAPQLRAEIFNSPIKAPRTPGVSVQTPGLKKKFADREASDVRTPGDEFDKAPTLTNRRLWDSDSEDELDEDGFSPPKTMQFHIPQSRLLQTPAREASKRIVEDLLYTAGGDITETTTEDSPSVVRQQVDLDDSF